MKTMMKHFDSSWTLFLDRDGVINDELLGSYVTQWEDFKFCKKASDAIKQTNAIFGKTFVVTNQRGVGRGIMSMEDLRVIHTKMVACLHADGIVIDRVYSATAVEDADHNRKPNPGMALQAQQDFPEIDFNRSVMVGNSISDMEFGRKLGMYTIFIKSKIDQLSVAEQSLVDEQFESLYDWASQLQVMEASCKE